MSVSLRPETEIVTQAASHANIRLSGRNFKYTRLIAPYHCRSATSGPVGCNCIPRSVFFAMRNILLVIVFASTALCCSSPGETASKSRAALTVLHWNDFHAQNIPFKVRDAATDSAYYVGGLAAFSGYVDSIRRIRPNVVLFNGGDEFQGTPISSISSGSSQIDLMNMIHPNGVTLGNHEFDYGMESLRANIQRATYPILCANVVSTSTNLSLGLLFDVQQIGAVIVGIIGVAPPDLGLLTFTKNLEGYRVREVDSSITIALADMRARVEPDLIVLLSHMGLGEDTLLAMRRSEFDLIVGGHSHTSLHQPMKKNGTIIVQAGSLGRYLGELNLVIDLNGDSVLSHEGHLIETVAGGPAPDQEIARRVAAYEAVVESKLGEVIGTLLTRWDRRGGGKVEMNIGNFECDVMRHAAQTDIAIHNVGGIRKDLDAGPVRVRDIWEINPFGNTLVTFTVTGSMLRAMFEFQAGVSPREFAQVSGLRYRYDSRKPRGQMLLSLEVNGRPVEDSRNYTICTNNYIGSHLDAFFGLHPSSITIEETGLVDRDVIIDYIRAHPRIDSRLEGRITDLNGM